MKPQKVKPKAQTDWRGFCKGGALLSTKWTFVRVVHTHSNNQMQKTSPTTIRIISCKPYSRYNR